MYPDAVPRRVCVLLVDDCVEQRDLYELVLARDFTVLSASRGEHAIEVVQRERPDIVVLDVQMPGISGLETCRRLKANPSTASIPVILLTGNDYSQNEGLAVGAFVILEKPCSAQILADTINAAFDCTAWR
jgi:putative two-component system response regulator